MKDKIRDYIGSHGHVARCSLGLEIDEFKRPRCFLNRFGRFELDHGRELVGVHSNDPIIILQKLSGSMYLYVVMTPNGITWLGENEFEVIHESCKPCK